MTTVYVQASAAITCCSCAVPFWIPEALYNMRRSDHDWFYCPNGHPQRYIAKTQAEQERDAAIAQRDRAWNEQAKAARERDDAQRELARIQKRHARGVCLYCKRTFRNVARHVQSKHADKASA